MSHCSSLIIKISGALSLESFILGVRTDNPRSRLVSEPTSISVVIDSEDDVLQMDPNEREKRTAQERSSWKPRTSFTESIQSLFRRKGRKTFPAARKSIQETPKILKIRRNQRTSSSQFSQIITNSDTSVLPVEPYENGGISQSNYTVQSSSTAINHIPGQQELPPLKLNASQKTSGGEQQLDTLGMHRDTKSRSEVNVIEV